MEDKEKNMDTDVSETVQEQVEEHHHHHHHHSHHHRHKHKSSRSKKFSLRKLKKSFKKHKKIWIPILMFLLIAVVVLAIWGVVDLMSAQEQLPQQAQGIERAVVITAPVFESEQRLVNAAVDKIMSYEQYDQPAHVVLKEFEGSSRLDVGMPVKLRFSLNNKPADYTVEKIVVETADNNHFLDSWEFTLDAGATSVDLYNLKTDTQYYYRIHYWFTNGIVSSAGGTFRTAKTPRILSIGGVYNARDIGGWVTTDGKTIRQGLLYRGTELDGSVQAEYRITEDGRRVMLEQLGIQMDMDLRWSQDNPSGTHSLGESVRHIYFGVEAYTNIFLENYQDAVRNVFSELAKEENYPIYMHCTYGRDRTGTIFALLEAVLGVDEEQIWRDYQLSALENIYQDNISFGSFLEALRAKPGNTLQEKAEGYLLSIGVTAEEIAAIRAIYLG